MTWRTKAVRALAPLALFLLALPAWAEQPAGAAAAGEPAAVSTPASTGDPAAAIPDLPENQAEIEAVRAGELQLETAPAAPAAPAPAALSPEMAEIEEAVAAERGQVADLEARLEAAPDETAALALLRQIEQVKQGTEVEILRIQARHARLAGRDEQAAEIEAVVQQMLAPVLAAPPAAAPGAAARPEGAGSAASPAGDERR